MPRSGSINSHPRKDDIISDLVARERPLNEMAAEYGMSASALSRYRTHEIPRMLAKATIKRNKVTLVKKRATGPDAVLETAERIREDTAAALTRKYDKEIAEGDILLGHLNGIMSRMQKMFDACDDYLTDPDDPSRYTLTTRAEEVLVTIEDESPTGRPFQIRMTLQEAIDKASGLNIVHARNMANDPRQLLIKTAQALEGHLRLLIDYAAEIRQQSETDITNSRQWITFRDELMETLRGFPEAQSAVIEAFSSAAV